MRILLSALLLLWSGLALAKGKSVEYEVNDAAYEGYFVKGGKSAPLVVILHDWDGLTDYEMKRAEMLRKQGYAVFAADLFGKGVRPTKVEDKMQHTGELYTDRKKMRDLIEGAIEQAGEMGANTDNAVVIGYCFGGAAVLEFARSGADMKGWASIHGGLGTPEGQDYKKTKGRVLIQHGAADSMISLDDFVKVTAALQENGIDFESIAYGGAPHAWTVFGSESYREEQEQASWTRLLNFLESTLK